MRYGLHDSRVELEDKVRKRKLVDLGPILLDAERCILCSRCLRFEREVTGTNCLEFVNRGNQTQIASFQYRPIEHQYAGNLADVCPVGALLSHEFRFKMRVWFLSETASICPGCSTGCNVWVDHRDGAIERVRPRRNAEVNKSWMCDPGRALCQQVGGPGRIASARLAGATGQQAVSLDAALDAVAERLKEAGTAVAVLATPQGTNEDLGALAEATGALLDFRVGDPQDRLEVRSDALLQRADRNPNTRGCLDLGLGRSGVPAILEACRSGRVKVLVLGGPELLLAPDAAEALAKVPFLAVMATHDGPELARAHAVLPAAAWAEVEGSFTNHARRVQRLRRAVPAPGDARPRWELASGLLQRLGKPLPAGSAREAFALLAKAAPGFAGLDHRALGGGGRVLAPAAGAGEARS